MGYVKRGIEAWRVAPFRYVASRRTMPRGGARPNTGGARPGAGRKPGPAGKKVAFSARLDPDLVVWLRQQPRPQAQVIEEALKIAYGLGPEMPEAEASIRTTPARVIAALDALDEVGADPISDDPGVFDAWQQLVDRLANR